MSIAKNDEIGMLQEKYAVKHKRLVFAVNKMTISLRHKPETIFFTLEILPI